MEIKPQNPNQLYYDVQKTSGSEIPLLHDFLKFALSRKDEKLVIALNSISEEEFLKPDKLIKYLKNSYFQKEQSKNRSWVSKIFKSKKRILEKSI